MSLEPDPNPWTTRRCEVHARLELETELRKLLLELRVDRLELRYVGPDFVAAIAFDRAGSQAAMEPWRTREIRAQGSPNISRTSTLLNLRAAEPGVVELDLYSSKTLVPDARVNERIDRAFARARALVSVMVSSDPEEWLDEAQRSNCYLNTLLYVLNATQASSAILWYIQRSRNPRLKAISRLGLRSAPGVPIMVDVGSGVVGRAVRDARLVAASREDISQLAVNPQLVIDEGWVSTVVVPLIFDSENVGALSIYDRASDLDPIALVSRIDRSIPVATLGAARASRDHMRGQEAEKLLSGAKRLQTGLTLIGLVHDLAKHASNVHQWAESLKEPLRMVSLRAGMELTVDDMIASAEIVGRITTAMDKLALGKDEGRSRIVIEDRLRDLRPILKRLDPKVRVTIRGQGVIYGSSSLVERIVLNLVMNSIHWTQQRDRDIHVDFFSNEADGTATLAVIDNGQGMTAAQIAVAREPFESGRENGSGLGLYMVDQMCSEVGARLQISSQPFVATTVSVTFDLKGHAVRGAAS